MILLTTSIEGTNYQIRPLKGQAFEKTLGMPLEDLHVRSNVGEYARFPLGTVFITTKEEFPVANEVFIPAGTVMPAYYGETPFSITDENKEEMWKHIINYHIDLGDEGIEFAKKLAKAIKIEAHGGVNIDVEEMLKPVVDESTGKLEGGASFRRSLTSLYAPPKVEDCGFQVDNDKWYLMVRNVLRGENTMVIGPTGLI
jgi:hypothetical protein